MTRPFAVTSQSEPRATGVYPRLQRTQGESRISFKRDRGGTRPDRLHQSGASKIRLPHVFSNEPPQAVLINTAGGLTGGDRMSVEVAVGNECHAVLTTQACERIYRAADGAASVRASLTVGERARLDWLPQETILFDGARLSRELEADLATGARLLLVEATIFGRAAHGETVRTGLFTDRWRIRQEGRLVFADDLRFDFSDDRLLSRPAVLAGKTVMATILLISDEPMEHLDEVRTLIGDHGGASAWNCKLLARIAAADGATLRRVLIPGLSALLGRATLPRIWQI